MTYLNEASDIIAHTMTESERDIAGEWKQSWKLAEVKSQKILTVADKI